MDDDEFIRQLDVKLGKGSAGGRGRELEGLAMGVDVAPPPSADESDGSAEERGWVLARRAMLCVREIVRTEKKLSTPFNTLAGIRGKFFFAIYMQLIIKRALTHLLARRINLHRWKLRIMFLGLLMCRNHC